VYYAVTYQNTIIPIENYIANNIKTKKSDKYIPINKFFAEQVKYLLKVKKHDKLFY
jgi:hypothetical protein